MEDIQLNWLGQSGFLLQYGELTFACDLYLSDYCQQKSRLDHTRMMAIPVDPASLKVDHYLITHGHIDHFDPLTVGPLMDVNSAMRTYCPPSCAVVIAENFSGCEDKFTFIRSGKPFVICDGITLIALPAAHEELEKDGSGEYVSLSYLLLFADTKKAVFFAGDTVPYSKQKEYITRNVPEDYSLVMVLPVNGRDEKRAKTGFKGNLTLDESVALAQDCGAQLMVPCHYGMFALNDIPEPVTARSFSDAAVHVKIPEINRPFCF